MLEQSSGKQSTSTHSVGATVSFCSECCQLSVDHVTSSVYCLSSRTYTNIHRDRQTHIQAHKDRDTQTNTCTSTDSRKPLWRESEPDDINSQWRESWKSASVVNAHLVDDPTIRQPGFALPRQQWSLLNHFRTGQGHCGACKKKWKLSDSDQCSCGETQTMSHIVKYCPQTRLACLNYTLQTMMPLPG